MILNFLKPYTKEFSYNLKLAYPVIIGMIGHTLVGFVDNAMVGQLGTSELAAISLGNSFVFLAMSFGIGFSVEKSFPEYPLQQLLFLHACRLFLESFLLS